MCKCLNLSSVASCRRVPLDRRWRAVCPWRFCYQAPRSSSEAWCSVHLHNVQIYRVIKWIGPVQCGLLISNRLLCDPEIRSKLRFYIYLIRSKVKNIELKGKSNKTSSWDPMDTLNIMLKSPDLDLVPFADQLPEYYWSNLRPILGSHRNLFWPQKS